MWGPNWIAARNDISAPASVPAAGERRRLRGASDRRLDRRAVGEVPLVGDDGPDLLGGEHPLGAEVGHALLALARVAVHAEGGHLGVALAAGEVADAGGHAVPDDVEVLGLGRLPLDAGQVRTERGDVQPLARLVRPAERRAGPVDAGA